MSIEEFFRLWDINTITLKEAGEKDIKFSNLDEQKVMVQLIDYE